MTGKNAFLILAVETSAAPSAVALLEAPAGGAGGMRPSPAVLGVREFARGKGGMGSDTPARAAELLLGAAGRRPAEVGLVAVSVGPGSYTGLRIGISFAKTFAWAVGAPAVAVPSLTALAGTAAAGGLPTAGGELLVATSDAFRGQLYARAFRARGGELLPLTGDLVMDAPTLIATLASLHCAGHLIFGPGASRHADGLQAAAQAVGLSISTVAGPTAPSAIEVGRLGLGLFAAGKTVTPHDLVPVYLRKTEAEERLAAGKTEPTT